MTGYALPDPRRQAPTADRVLTQLAPLSERDDFHRLAAALQRARRILPAEPVVILDTSLPTEPAERKLYDVAAKTKSAIKDATDLEKLVSVSKGLPEAVDAFFGAVLVIAEDPEIRGVRLGLVAIVAALDSEAVN